LGKITPHDGEPLKEGYKRGKRGMREGLEKSRGVKHERQLRKDIYGN